MEINKKGIARLYVCLHYGNDGGEPYAYNKIFYTKEHAILDMLDSYQEIFTNLLDNEALFNDFKYYGKNNCDLESLKKVDIKELYDLVYTTETANKDEIKLLNDILEIQQDCFTILFCDEEHLCVIDHFDIQL